MASVSGTGLAGEADVQHALEGLAEQWKAQGSQHHYVSLHYKTDHKQWTLLTIDAEGKYTIKAEKSHAGAVSDDKVAKKADAMLGDMIKQEEASPGQTIYKHLKTGGNDYLVWVHPDGTYGFNQVTNWKDGEALDRGIQVLANRMKLYASDPGQAHPLTLKVKVAKDDEWQLTLNPDGTLKEKQTKKPDSGGFLGGLFDFIKDIAAPVLDVAAIFVPPLVVPALALSAVKGVSDLADGNILGGVLGLTGSVGSLVGGVTRTIAQDLTQAVSGGFAVTNAAQNGDVLGVIAAAGKTASGYTGGSSSLAGQIGTAATDLRLGQSFLQSGDVLGAVGATAGSVATLTTGDTSGTAWKVSDAALGTDQVLHLVGSGNVGNIVSGVGRGVQVAGNVTGNLDLVKDGKQAVAGGQLLNTALSTAGSL